jgi:hypothetical protein
MYHRTRSIFTYTCNVHNINRAENLSEPQRADWLVCRLVDVQIGRADIAFKVPLSLISNQMCWDPIR